MEEQIFAVYDNGVKTWMTPFFAPTIEVAIREFRRLVNNPETTFHAFPEDYTLFHIGTWHPKTAKIDSEETPHSLGVAITFIAKPDFPVSARKED